MRPIILASKSKARKSILSQAGLKFKVKVSQAREQTRVISTISQLVKQNALTKARAVAKTQKHGVIIGADTVVECQGKIIGKPKDLVQAKKVLKLLSRKPQTVYSGIAVIDLDSGKKYTDYQKTKVYMYPLTDKQINGYFKKICPLEKAGSYDIQGPGGLFVDRINGCYYNVVGLPLAKLARILEKLGIDLF